MIIINIFIAIIIAIGFWRNTSKEHKRMVAKASLTKTAILFLLSAAITFFYYKSYQVATFRNWVVVKGVKGSYTNENDTIASNGDTIIYKAKDRIKLLTILSKFTNNDSFSAIPFLGMWDSINSSGTRTYIHLYNNKGNTKWYPNITPDDIPYNHEDISHKYKVSYYTNTIPNIMPFAYYDDYALYDDSLELAEGVFYEIGNYGFRLSKTLDDIGNNYDKCFVSDISTKKNNIYNEDIYFKVRTKSNYVNTLNFFSAADLSQCEYEVKLESDIPIENLSMFFDLPVEISSLNPSEHNVVSKGFYMNIEEDIAGKTRYLIYHVKFPTLANLQLIRSLILTTLLTVLFSLFFKNLYYYCRKIFERRKREKKTLFTYSRKMVLLWIPVGKFIVWSFILLCAFLLFLSILNLHFRIDATFVTSFKLIIAACIVLYVVLVCLVFSFLYRKGIYFRDLKEKIINKDKKIKNKKEDVKPSPEADEKVEETSKIEEKSSNEVAIQKDIQKPSSKLSQPKKGKTRKRKR